MENPRLAEKDSDGHSAALTYGKALHPIKIEIERNPSRVRVADSRAIIR
jgi:hypothetical protein